MSSAARWLQARWYGGAPVPIWLGALEYVFVGLSALRRWLYRQGIMRSAHPGVPVIVVGNLVAGGSGKTPLVIALVRMLAEAGWRPGVVSRGYGRTSRGLHRVGSDSHVDQAGDEPLEVFAATGVPVVVASDRLAAARVLVDAAAVDCIIADDGLQHYRLRRDIEIVSVDADRGLGNGRRLPAGPLREPPSRLESVDMVLTRNGEGEAAWTLDVVGMRALNDPSAPPESMDAWRGRAVHAIAGLAHPEAFFGTLRQHGLDLRETRSFPDHHVFRSADLRFGDALPLIITAKDAVKCRDLGADTVHVLEVRARLPESARSAILERMRALTQSTPPS